MSTQVRLQIVPNPDWKVLDQLSDRTLAQTKEWVEFIAETQNAQPVVAQILKDDSTVGWFTGLIVKKFGLRILGSPFPGWTTSYMGFNLTSNLDRGEVLMALIDFALRDLKCVHVELMDRGLNLATVQGLKLKHRVFRGYEIDLTQDEDVLFARMSPACRRCIRKAEKSGVTVEVGSDEHFAEEYYEQLKEVFGRQRLTPTYSLERVQALVRHNLPGGHLLLLRARDDKSRCIATGVFPAFNDTMYFWGGASRLENRHLRPNEAIQWFAMRYWKNRGIIKYDMGGGGEYKEKYGGAEIAVPWVRQSRNVFISMMREAARWTFDLKQRLYGMARPIDPPNDE